MLMKTQDLRYFLQMLLKYNDLIESLMVCCSLRWRKVWRKTEVYDMHFSPFQIAWRATGRLSPAQELRKLRGPTGIAACRRGRRRRSGILARSRSLRQFDTPVPVQLSSIVALRCGTVRMLPRQAGSQPWSGAGTVLAPRG